MATAANGQPVVDPTQPHSLYSQAQLETIWQQMQFQISPVHRVVCMDIGLYDILDNGAKHYIAHRFRAHIGEKVMFCRDGTRLDRVFLGAPRDLIHTGCFVIMPSGADAAPYFALRENLFFKPVADPAPVRGKTKIPRPPNAFILYRRDKQAAVKESNPDITNNEISQVLGRAWNLESRDVRRTYQEKSATMKQALLEKHPDYQYRPRKPSERKRRARRSNNAQTEADEENTTPGSTVDGSDGL